MSMVERVARAMEAAALEQAKLTNLTDAHGFTRAMARAAIEAMREPTEAQKQAACVEADKHGYYHTRGYFGVDEADYSWRAMIDSALVEEPKNAK